MIIPCVPSHSDPGKPVRFRVPRIACLVATLGVLRIPMTPLIARSQPMAPAQDETIDAKQQSLIIDSVAVALDSNYVFPDVARKMGKYLHER